MGYYAAKRLSDGLIFLSESPMPPSNLIARAVDGYGGSTEDWVQIELSGEAGQNALAVLPAQSYWLDNALMVKSIQLNSDKAQITADGLDAAALTADTGDPSYTGAVKFTVTAPDRTRTISTVNAVNGIASETLTTEQVEAHLIRAEATGFGYDEITIEGV